MKFKTFLTENEEILAKIQSILDEMDSEELDDFGTYLVDMFMDDLPEDEYDQDFTKEDVLEMIKALGYDFYDEILDELSELEDDWDEDGKTNEAVSKYKQIKQVYDVVMELGPNAKFVDIITHLGNVKDTTKLSTKEFERYGDLVQMALDADVIKKDKAGYCVNMNESVSRRMKTTNYNRKKRKFMQVSRSELRQTRSERRKKARQTRSKRKRYYRANKQKVAAYQKSRREAIKKGKHKVKKRRST